MQSPWKPVLGYLLVKLLTGITDYSGKNKKKGFDQLCCDVVKGDNFFFSKFEILLFDICTEVVKHDKCISAGVGFC